jgi:predicted signal transduction protein with EAL and GGDEF domain
VFVRDEQRALVVLDELKDIGVTLALDDFGTGYSSLAYLNTLPIDSVKIDQSFIATLTHDPDSQRIVTAIIALAHSLEMTVVAEGVETASQHRELARLGADCCQGFYFGKPMPAVELDTLLRSQPHASTSLTTKHATLEFAAQMCCASDLRPRNQTRPNSTTEQISEKLATPRVNNRDGGERVP